MYVLSNASGVLAPLLFLSRDPGAVSEKIGEGIMSFQVSLHEVIVVPESAGFDAGQLTDMVKDANSSVSRQRTCFQTASIILTWRKKA